MKLLTFENIIDILKDKSIVIAGSGPGVLDNDPGYIDSFDYVIRINNFKCIDEHTGSRTDIVYSFWGGSIRKYAEELKDVKLLMCKCPNCHCHGEVGNFGGDFRYIYNLRKDFYSIPVYIPTKERYFEYFNLLNGHVPTTGFACILEIMKIKFKRLYITGFDFFKSGKHNIHDTWVRKNPDDPIGHVPDKELSIVKEYFNQGYIEIDKLLKELFT